MATQLQSLQEKANHVRTEFPVLQTKMRGLSLAYLDNGATTQKPQSVIDTITDFYSHQYGTIHRGVYELSQNATIRFDEARRTVQRFINAERFEEVIFLRGTTEAINLIAYSFGRKFIVSGDEIVITEMEHHANIVPWQELCAQTGARLKIAPMTDKGELDLAAFKALLSPKTKLVGVVHVSNALGTVNPVQQIIQWAHDVGAKVLVDGAQAVQHMPVDVQALDCDFYCFSGHKLYGPTGIGVLYGKYELLDQLPPFHTGGDMIESVHFDKTTYAQLPMRLEAGTPAIAEPLGLAAAIEYVSGLGFDFIQAWESELLDYATQKVSELESVRFIGQADDKASVLSFLLGDIHPHDIGTVLDMEGVAVRVGHHCAQPVMDHFGVPATVRASFSFYNNFDDIDRMVAGLRKAQSLLG